ncbi:MAG: n-acetylglutamate synthase [Alphaproteobacteria bacterium]
MPRLNYDNRRFRSLTNSAGGDVDGATIFRYRQRGDIVWASYDGGAVAHGQLIAKMAEDGTLDMRYHHATVDGRLMAGTCRSRLEILPDGRYRLHEEWQWTGGAEGSGRSVVEEIEQ